MGIINTLQILVSAVRFIVTEKKRMEANAQAYLSPERAKTLRLWLEKAFLALQEGEANQNYAKLPRIVKWFCGSTKIDNYIGTFGQQVLKSQKLAEDQPALRTEMPIYPVH